MATSIAELVINLRANTASFVRELDKSRTLSTAFGVAVGKVMAGVAGQAANMAVRVATSVPRAFLASADAADQLFKSSQKIGISVEALSGLKHAAELSGVAFEQMETGVARLSRSMRDSLSGSNEASKAYRALGVEVKNSDGTLRASEDVLRDLADRFSKMPDGANKTALAMILLGRAGANLIPFLNQGAAGFDRMMQEARKLGLVISTETAKAAEEFNDNLQNLSFVTTGFANSLMSATVPSLAVLTKAMVEVAAESEVATAAGKGLAPAFDSIVKVALTSALGVTGFAGALSMLAEEIQRVRLAGAEALPDFLGADVQGLRKGLEEREQRTLKIANSVQGILDLWNKIDEVAARPPSVKTPGPEQLGKAADQLVENLKAQIKAGQAELDKLELRPRLLTGEIQKQVKDLGDLLDVDVEIRVPEPDLSKFTAEWMETTILMDEMRAAMEETAGTIEFMTTRQAAWNKTIEDLGLIQPELAKVEEGAKKISERGKEAGEAFEQLSHTITSGFENAILSGEGLRGTLAGILEDIGKIILRATITGPEGILGKLLTGVGGALGGLLGGGGKSVPVEPIFSQFADGGFVGPGEARVPAMLHAGEFVLQRAAVEHLGVPALEKLNLGAKLPQFQFGGFVGDAAPSRLFLRGAELSATPRAGQMDAHGGGVSITVNQKNTFTGNRGDGREMAELLGRATRGAVAEAVARSVNMVHELALRTP